MGREQAAHKGRMKALDVVQQKGEKPRAGPEMGLTCDMSSSGCCRGMRK